EKSSPLRSKHYYNNLTNQQMYMKTNVLKQVMCRTGMLSLALTAFCLDTGTLMASPDFAIDRGPMEMSIQNEVDVTVTGTVTDALGEPIPGVTVSVPGTTIGT